MTDKPGMLVTNFRVKTNSSGHEKTIGTFCLSPPDSPSPKSYV